MKIKTSELTGAALDWAVRLSRGDAVSLDEDQWVCVNGIADMPLAAYTPSTDWAQGGPIIERERITVTYNDNDDVWEAFYESGMNDDYERGSTPLIAAMRCYVASKLGDEVDVPEELLT